MDDQLEVRIADIRRELKVWEAEWASSHGGKKPGRGDIKANADIALRYKEYGRLREAMAAKPSEGSRPHQKRKASAAPPAVDVATPSSKRTRHILQSPSKGQQQSIPGNVFSTPSSSSKEVSSPVAIINSIGPTPQRDGRVLGLFDLLPVADSATPSRHDRLGPAIPHTTSSQLQTPSKNAAREEEVDDARLGRTPMSSTKRNLFNSIVTPLQNRDPNTPAFRTPTSVSKIQFNTPAFLRRRCEPIVEEGVPIASPVFAKRTKKPFARGLSAIVASLRKVEEEQFDDDEAAMREMEGLDSVTGSQQAAAMPPPNNKTTVPDSQTLPRLLSGLDDETKYDSPVEEDNQLRLGRDGKPLREYKKRGQKRTTRRVNMKPVRVKRLESGAGEEESDADVVPETQYVPVEGLVPGDNQREMSPPSDIEALDDEYDPDKENTGKTQSSRHHKMKGEKSDEKRKEGSEGPVRKVARKVNSLAHANFKRLKLRNSGSKGGPGYNSRFRRKR